MARAPCRLQLATSRSLTAQQPLTSLTVASVNGWLGITELYAGASQPVLTGQDFPGLTLQWPLREPSVALHVRSTRPESIIVLILDLGVDTDLARLELWGNPLLAAAAPGGHPEANMGLPRTLAVLGQQGAVEVADRRGRVEPGTFSGPFELLDDWDLRRLLRDLRGAWGWTPVTLAPTFARRLMLVCSDLPRLGVDRAGAPVFGIDMARIVAYPFLQGSDHQPHVEFTPIGTWQEAYRVPSDYWATLGVASPNPRIYQSVLREASTGALLLPSALASGNVDAPGVGEIPFYASDLLTDQGERAWLVVETGTDAVPLIEALRLTFRLPPGAKGYAGPKLPYLPDYLVSIDATDDREAAYSSDRAHPAWRPVAREERIFASSVREQRIHLVEPVCARWLRISAKPVFRAGIDVPGLPFLLHRLDLLRPRDWLAVPAPDEDFQIDSVVLRLRGRDLVSDYAFIDGEHGTDVAVELMREGGAWEEIRAFRTLTDLIENLATRVFQNARRSDKPVQRLHETSRATTQADMKGQTTSSTDATVRVDPNDSNFTRTQTASFTRYDDEPIPGLTADGLTTTRTFAGNLNDLVPPVPDLAALDPQQLQQIYTDYALLLIAQGLPVSVGVGGNVGGNVGISAIAQGGFNIGVGVNVGTQVGGGVTKSVIEGSQGVVVDARSETLEARNRQRTTSSQTTSAKQTTKTQDDRHVVRRDLSVEVRKHGLEVRYGGEYQDMILAALPLTVLLRGTPDRLEQASGPAIPLASQNRLRVRVGHLPPSVVLDVEFRGKRIPREGAD